MDAILDQQAQDDHPTSRPTPKAPREAAAGPALQQLARAAGARAERTTAKPATKPRTARQRKPSLSLQQTSSRARAPAGPPAAARPLPVPPPPAASAEPPPPMSAERQALVMDRSLLPSMLASAL